MPGVTPLYDKFSRLLLAAFLLAGCRATAAPTPGQTPVATQGATATLQPTPTPTIVPAPPPLTVTPFQPLPTSETISLWLHPDLPAGFSKVITPVSGILNATDKATADFRLEIDESNPVSEWVYALVTPFPTILNGVTSQDVLEAWKGESSGPYAGKPLAMDENTLKVLSALWGEPAENAVFTLPDYLLADYAWQNQPAWAIVPFEALEPRWKVLEIDGNSPIRKGFEASQYLLRAPISLTQAAGDDSQIAVQELFANLPNTNRDSGKLTTLAMTGVTALVRATAETMERKGMTYPAQDVRDILLDADITHVSNEVPFDTDCPKPDPFQEGLRFCSRTKYYALLEDIDMDIVELTGDHFGDQGPDAMRYTLDLYRQKNIPYFGGGYNEQDARQPVLIEHNGNKLAFIGCNGKGGGYATARGIFPGAIDCEGDWMQQEIARLKAEGYITIVTTQHFEYYTYAPMPLLIEDFHSWAEAGADIISGSQAHQPHGFEYYRDAWIHYGLGNLFFDQIFLNLETQQGFIDRHVFYDGRHISSELIPITFIDLARPRPATPQEAEKLLNNVFSNSLW